mgnify:CR=1 FL=1
MIFIVAIVLAILAPIISRFIQLAVNRQREYLEAGAEVTVQLIGAGSRPAVGQGEGSGWNDGSQ